jgi:hypothetical protein
MIDNMQKHLQYNTMCVFRLDLESTKLRGVIVYWREQDKTVCLSFYFDGPISEADREEASDLAGGIAACLSEGLMEEEFIRLDTPLPLPESPYWGYRRPGEGFF